MTANIIPRAKRSKTTLPIKTKLSFIYSLSALKNYVDSMNPRPIKKALQGATAPSSSKANTGAPTVNTNFSEQALLSGFPQHSIDKPECFPFGIIFSS